MIKKRMGKFIFRFTRMNFGSLPFTNDEVDVLCRTIQTWVYRYAKII